MAAGNRAEQKRILIHTLELWRRRGDDGWVAEALRYLSKANRQLGLYEEGIQQVKEASEIYIRTGNAIGQTWCLNDLAWLLFDDHQLTAAEDTASRAIDLVPEKGQEVVRCQLHRILGQIYRSKGKKEEAIHHLETAIKVASPFNWHEELCWIYYALAQLFLKEKEFDNANARLEQARSHTFDRPYRLGRVMHLQAIVLYRQGRLEDAKSEALHALEIFEQLGVATDAGICGDLLQEVEQSLRSRATSS
jgi:tetratricopeptide (TPR) repeat protein